MNNHGYIYVKNWERRQHHKYEGPPWHKVYNDLLRHDDYLRLTSADRGLLHDLWTLASLSGDGRVSADRKLLARQLNVRRVSLEPLIQAGFIRVLGTKRVRDEYEPVAQSESESQSREEKVDVSRNRSSRAGGTVSIDQPEEPRPELPKALERILAARVLDDLTNDQRDMVARAWFHGVELRHSLASVEAAANPTAMLVSISRRITNQEEPAA